MKLDVYKVDAFASELFTGNPAAVCPLTEWLPDTLMQQIAMENNISETAFFVKEGDQYTIRWFTPAVEVALCGHATLASAHVLYNHLGYTEDSISFVSPKSGSLPVTRTGDKITLDFPCAPLTAVPSMEPVLSSLNTNVLELYRGTTDFLAVLESEEAVRNFVPDFERIKQSECRGIIITAKGKDVDFVSRFFAPLAGVNEDPVTGSAHTMLTPYWAKALNKQELTALQVSARGGRLWLTLQGDRVLIAGTAKTFLTGSILLP
jgi:PhzF family phenazine biosynthesis protein